LLYHARRFLPVLSRMRLTLADETLDLSAPLTMGIVNVTPDSFSDGGCFASPAAAVARGLQLVEEGAAILDVGGESTRPGAGQVPAREEVSRVVPVIRGLAQATGIPMAVDTSKPEVMEAAVEAGATMINDVRALRTDGALRAAATAGVAVCLMHMQGEPRTMQAAPDYENVVEEVYAFLAQRIEACLAAGIEESRILVDPGFGFGKTLAHNLMLMRGLGRLLDLGRPVLVGLSRKSMIGAILDRPVGERLWGSLALAVMAVERGASIVRVHEVAPTMDVLKMAVAVTRADGH